MKYLILILLVNFLSCNYTRFYIDGKLVNKIDTVLYLVYLDYQTGSPVVMDSCKSINGKFYFKGKINKMIDVAVSNSSKGQNGIPYFIEGGRTELVQEIKEEEDSPLLRFIEPNNKSTLDRKKFNLKIREIYNFKRDSIFVNDSLLYVDANNRLVLFEEFFIKDNPDSYFSAYYLYIPYFGFRGSIDSKIALYSILTPNVKKSYYGKLLGHQINEFKKYKKDNPSFKFINETNKN